MSRESEIVELVLDTSTVGLGCSLLGGTDTERGREGKTGILVGSVLPDGAAYAGGLRADDVIICVNDQSLTDVTHSEALRIIGEQDQLHVSVLRSTDILLNRDYNRIDAQDSSTALVPQMSRAEAARKAFEGGDVAMSIYAHDNIAPEKHTLEGGVYLKSMVFGGLDGIITTFAVVASVQGANLSTGVVLVMGFANLIADGISMGFGEYLSETSEGEWIAKEKKRETWEFDNFPEGEIKEMIDLYVEKGFSHDEASTIINMMAKHKKFFIDHMMVQELGILPEDEDEEGGVTPAKKGLVIFFSFMVFGLVPLLAYLAIDPIGIDGDGWDPIFMIACLLTACALFGLGAAKSKFSSVPWYRSGAQVLVNGGLAAAAAYLIGFLLEKIVDAECI